MRKNIFRVLIPLMLVSSLIIISTVPALATSPPTVFYQYPISGSAGVPLNIQPYILFSKSMDGTTINHNTIQLMSGGTPVTANVAFSNTNRVVITPSVSLNASATYSLMVNTGVKDTNGNAMTAPYTGSFTTIGPISPTVSSQSPIKGATGAALNAQPYIIFSKPMDSTTINSSTIQLMNGSAPVTATVALSGINKAIITPSVPLTYGETYYIVVNTGVKDTYGNTLAAAYGSPSASEFTTIAPIPPAISSQYPAKGATGVPFNIQPYIVFSKSMDYTTINSY